jgi:hypothetical protein
VANKSFTDFIGTLKKKPVEPLYDPELLKQLDNQLKIKPGQIIETGVDWAASKDAAFAYYSMQTPLDSLLAKLKDLLYESKGLGNSTYILEQAVYNIEKERMNYLNLEIYPSPSAPFLKHYDDVMDSYSYPYKYITAAEDTAKAKQEYEYQMLLQQEKMKYLELDNACRELANRASKNLIEREQERQALEAMESEERQV